MADAWWNKHYKYRKQVSFDLTKGDLSNHFARVYFSKDVVNNGKMRPDFLDVRIVYNGVTVISSSDFLIENSDDQVVVRFKYPSSVLVDYSYDTDDRFYIYYGDIYAESPEATLPDEPLPEVESMADDYTLGLLDVSTFPEIIFLGQSDPRIGVTRPGEDWVIYENLFLVSPRSKQHAKISFDFYGDSVGFYAPTNPYSGNLTVSVDGEEVEIDLYLEPGEVQEDDFLVYKATGLDETLHNLTIENRGRRSPESIHLSKEALVDLLDELYTDDIGKFFTGDFTQPTFAYAIGYSGWAVGTLGLEESVDTLKWNSKIGGIV